VAKIEQLPVTKDMISKMGVDGKYANEVVFSIDPKYQNKSVILCLAGHLVFPNEHNFKKIADNDWLLSMSDLPIIERYFESKNYIDYSSLGLTVFPDNPNKINVEEFLSDEVLEKYITHEQSFFIVVEHLILSGIIITYEVLSFLVCSQHTKNPRVYCLSEEVEQQNTGRPMKMGNGLLI